jgi:hypothetical protein
MTTVKKNDSGSSLFGETKPDGRLGMSSKLDGVKRLSDRNKLSEVKSVSNRGREIINELNSKQYMPIFKGEMPVRSTSTLDEPEIDQHANLSINDPYQSINKSHQSEHTFQDKKRNESVLGSQPASTIFGQKRQFINETPPLLGEELAQPTMERKPFSTRR